MKIWLKSLENWINSVAANVDLFPQMSTDLKIENKFDILVTEIFDCGLLGEDAVRSILDAKKRLLSKNAEIIPAKATIYCQGIGLIHIADSARSRWHFLKVSFFRSIDCTV